MVNFNTIKSYVMEAKIGDHIALATYTLIPKYRFQTFNVVDIFRGKITVRPFNQRMRVIIEDEQQVVLLTNAEYKSLGR